MSRKAITAYFNFTMDVKCPNCHALIDLDDSGYNDEGEASAFFREWINNESEKLDKGFFEVDCAECGHKFVITEIKR